MVFSKNGGIFADRKKEIVMKIKIELTDKHILLLRNFKLDTFNDQYVGVDTYGMYGGTYLLEDMADILGYADKRIPGTEEDTDGVKFPEDITKELLDLDAYIVTNLVHIEEILHQFADTGIKPGTYEASDIVKRWKYVEKK